MRNTMIRGVLLRQHIYGPDIDEPVPVINVASGVLYWYHYDGLGSVVALSKWNSGLSRGEVVERYAYDAFGRTRIFDAAGGELTQSAFGNPYMYTGRRYDPETGLYHYRARAYSPDLGRFLQPDPIGYADSMNMYAYCLNDPVNWVDPWGRARGGKRNTLQTKWLNWSKKALDELWDDILRTPKSQRTAEQKATIQKLIGHYKGRQWRHSSMIKDVPKSAGGGGKLIRGANIIFFLLLIDSLAAECNASEGEWLAEHLGYNAYGVDEDWMQYQLGLGPLPAPKIYVAVPVDPEAYEQDLKERWKKLHYVSVDQATKSKAE